MCPIRCLRPTADSGPSRLALQSATSGFARHSALRRATWIVFDPIAPRTGSDRNLDRLAGFDRTATGRAGPASAARQRRVLGDGSPVRSRLSHPYSSGSDRGAGPRRVAGAPCTQRPDRRQGTGPLTSGLASGPDEQRSSVCPRDCPREPSSVTSEFSATALESAKLVGPRGSTQTSRRLTASQLPMRQASGSLSRPLRAPSKNPQNGSLGLGDASCTP